MSDTRDNLRGIVLMLLAMGGFAIEDMFVKWAAQDLPTGQILLLLGIFGTPVFALMARHQGGSFWTRDLLHPAVMWRNIGEMVGTFGFITALALTELTTATAIFQASPLAVTLGAALFLGEKVGWRRWTAIVIGFVGMMIILQPGVQAFSPAALLPLAAATMFALYGLLTRLVARVDSANVSFFWTGLVGAIAMTPLGLWHWEHLAPVDWGWLLALCVASMASHYMLIRAYAVAEASAIQPFSFLQLVFVTILGVTLFGEVLKLNVVIGTIVVVGAGLFTLWRARVKGQDVPPPPERA